MPKQQTTIVITEIDTRGEADFGHFYFSDGVRVGYRRLGEGWQTFGGGKYWPEPTPLRLQVVSHYLRTHGPVELERTIDISNEGTPERPWGVIRISDGTVADFDITRPGETDAVTVAPRHQRENTPDYIRWLVDELTQALVETDWSALPAASKTVPVDQAVAA
jgi:hypothetical protein